MAFDPPPRGLRLIQLADRIILHDLTFALANADPSSRNSLIDAANSVHLQNLSPRRDFDLLDLDLRAPPSSASSESASKQNHRYLILPFASERAPHDPPPAFEASTPEEAGLSAKKDEASLHVDAVPAFLGVLPLHSAVFAVFASQVRHAADLPSGSILSVSKASLLPLTSSLPTKEDRDIIIAVTKLLESGAMYYSLNTDLTRAHGSSPSRKRPFQWNFPLIARLPSSVHNWSPLCMYGFVSAHRMTFRANTAVDFRFALVSRRSRRRAGTRYITRGVDALGNVANFVETEQLVWCDDKPDLVASFLIIRGSIPVFWRQNNGIARPAPELDAGLVSSRRAFALHYDSLRSTYTNVCAVSLVDKHGPEAVLAQAYDRHFDLYKHTLQPTHSKPNLVAFDFHSHCAGKEYERGLALLMKRLLPDLEEFGFSFHDCNTVLRAQCGVFRVNCVDCLDRTNVVQTMVARLILTSQLEALFANNPDVLFDGLTVSLFQESEDRFKHLWGDNADAISKQYSGTGALKTDFTRTGKRSTSGVIGDGVKSVMRMYYKNFVDEGRQEVIDILCGNAVVRQQTPSILAGDPGITSANRTSGSEPGWPATLNRVQQPSSLWYSFEAMRINAGGDKQPVFVELYDNVMYVTTAEGISFEYPRKSLQTWSKYGDVKTTDRRASARLRLMYKALHAAPATASPLDLLFRGGVTMRENFLRALVSWAQPEAAELMTGGDLRIRVLAGLNVGDHYLADWSLDETARIGENPDVVVVVVPEVSATSRGYGLAAVPVDIDASGLVVISAFSAAERGPALAVLVSPTAAQAVMSLDEAAWTASSAFAADGVVGVSFELYGTSLCFLSARVAGPSDLQTALTGLKLGRSAQDITIQFDHFIVAGLLGEVSLGMSRGSSTGTASKRWAQADDGSFCYSLENGLSVIRNSLPTLRYDNVTSIQNLGSVNNASSSTMTCTCLVDGVVDRGSAPKLPQSLSRCRVILSEIRGEDIKIPRGVDSNAQMLCTVVVQSALATVDSVSSRPTQRATTYPEWIDKLELPMIPSDPDDVFNSFIYGQISVPNVLGDPFVAGYFVVALATARDGTADFDVRCRRGGQVTGRVVGRVRVDVVDLNNESQTGLTTQASANDFQSLRKTKSVGNKGSVYTTSLRSKGGLDDMNERLEVARRKGAKQMKSVVSKLSSLLSQPSTSSNVRTSVAPAPLPDVPSGSTLQSRNEKMSGLDGFKSLSAQPALPRKLGTSAVTSVSPPSVPASADSDVDKRFKKSKSAVIQESPLSLETDGSAKQNATVTNLNNKIGADELLLGLADSKGKEGTQNKGMSTNNGDRSTTVPPHAGESDLLLSGLASHKQTTVAPCNAAESAGKGTSHVGLGECTNADSDSDFWGDFESAGPQVTLTPSTSTSRTKRKDSVDLIDW